MDSWRKAIPLMGSGYLAKLEEEVASIRRRETVYPPPDRVLHALEATPFDRVKVVILGQDPYHGEGQAHGLAFSVPVGVKAPPSLRNIFKEIDNDLHQGGVHEYATDLSRWADQGVLLLNTVLTVAKGRAGSHGKLGWGIFTDQIITELSAQWDHLVFMLWGAHAAAKKKLVDGQKHLVLEAPHPSPLSAYRGFFGCAHFSKANLYLEQHGKTPIVW